MSEGWPIVPLSRVMEQRKEFIEIDDTKTYKRCRVQLHAKGVGQRDIVVGSEVKTKRQQVCRAGEFLVAEIDAKVGGFGMVSDALDGAIVSSHYFLFETDAATLDRRFLDFYIRTPAFREQVTAQGSTNYAAIRPRDVLGYTMPLPPLSEQRRIVGRIEELAGKIEEARGLRREAVEEADVVFSSAMNNIWRSASSWKAEVLGQIAKTVSGQVDPKVEPYCDLPHISGENIQSGTCRLLPYNLAKNDGITSGKYHFQPGSILYSKIRPYLRKAVQVPVEGICSADIYAFNSVSQNVVPRFLMYSLISPHFTDYANLLSGRTRMPKLNQNQLFAYQMSYPGVPEQERIVAYLDGLQAKVDALKALQGETEKELAALLPSVLDRAFSGRL